MKLDLIEFATTQYLKINISKVLRKTMGKMSRKGLRMAAVVVGELGLEKELLETVLMVYG